MRRWPQTPRTGALAAPSGAPSALRRGGAGQRALDQAAQLEPVLADRARGCAAVAGGGAGEDRLVLGDRAAPGERPVAQELEPAQARADPGERAGDLRVAGRADEHVVEAVVGVVGADAVAGGERDD